MEENMDETLKRNILSYVVSRKCNRPEYSHSIHFVNNTEDAIVYITKAGQGYLLFDREGNRVGVVNSLKEAKIAAWRLDRNQGV